MEPAVEGEGLGWVWGKAHTVRRGDRAPGMAHESQILCRAWPGSRQLPELQQSQRLQRSWHPSSLLLLLPPDNQASRVSLEAEFISAVCVSSQPLKPTLGAIAFAY